MKNFKKTLSLAMATVFATSAVVGGLPAEKVQAASSTSMTVTLSTKATNAVAKSLKGKNKTLTLKPAVNGKEVVATQVTYKSSKKSVATVSKKGVVTTKKAGKSTITMSYVKGSKTYTASVNLTVKPVSATKIKLSKTAKTLKKGATVTLKATFSPSNATDVTSDVKWKSSKSSVVSVKNGKITGIKPGKATITATLGSLSAKCTVTVTNPAVKIKLNRTKLPLELGSDYTLTATVKPKTTTDKTVVFTSDKPYICKVNKTTGHLKTISPGVAYITAKAGSVTTTCKVRVKSPVAVESISVTPENAEVLKGETVQLTATVSPSNAKDQTLSWKSANTDIATVDANGLVTGVSGGTTTITVTASNKKFAIATIVVKDENIDVTDFVVPSEVQVGKGLTQKITPSAIVTSPAGKESSVNFKWSSSDNSVATVEDGLITGVSEGTATITVTAGSKSKTITVTVSDSSKAVIQGSQAKLTVEKDKIANFKTTVPRLGEVVVTPEQIEADCSTLKELTNQKWDNDVLYDVLYTLKTKDEEGNSKFQSIAAFGDVVNKDTENVSVVDEEKKELADIDCDAFWSKHTSAVEVTDAGVDITFNTKMHEVDEKLNWFGPIFVVYTAGEEFTEGDAPNGLTDYSEYFVGRADVFGWAGTGAIGTPEMPELEKVYPGGENTEENWAEWRDGIAEGKKGELSARFDGNKLVITFKVNGAVSTSYVEVDRSKPVYIDLTGEQCSVTDITATQRTYNKKADAHVSKLITDITSGRTYDGEISKNASSLTISVKGSGRDQVYENVRVQEESEEATAHTIKFTLKGNDLTAVVGKEGTSFDLTATKYGITAPILHFVNSETTFELEGNQEALESMGLGSLLGALQATAK